MESRRALRAKGKVPCCQAKELYGGKDMDAVKLYLEATMGTKDDDALGDDKNEKLQAYLEQIGDVNFYTYTALMVIDPDAGFETIRSQMKMVLLPMFQLLVPFGMSWFFFVTQDMIADNGWCSNHDGYIFRFTGFVTFLYSAWQIIDGAEDQAALFYLRQAVEHWALTGSTFSWRAIWMFNVGIGSQQICSVLILVLTYITFTTQCDTPLDLLMNCVAVNFVLDVDAEWMGDKQQGKSADSAVCLFKYWRDDELGDRNITDFPFLRRNAVKYLDVMQFLGNTLIKVLAYSLVISWTFCPASW